MSAPEFERVLGEHRIHGFNGVETACTYSPRKWRNEREHRAHLAAALNAEVARIVAAAKAEPLIEAAGQVRDTFSEDDETFWCSVAEWLDLLAHDLAPTDTTADEKGAGR